MNAAPGDLANQNTVHKHTESTHFYAQHLLHIFITSVYVCFCLQRSQTSVRNKYFCKITLKITLCSVKMQRFVYFKWCLFLINLWSSDTFRISYFISLDFPIGTFLLKCKNGGFVFSCYQMDIHGRIREVLADIVRDDQGPAHQSLSEADLLRALQRRGIIDDVMKDLHFNQVFT